jgi:hypothetical protein
MTNLCVQHVAKSFSKQLQLGSIVGNLEWTFDVPTGTLSFGNVHNWNAEILGTESHQANTWLWAWANTGSNLPPALIQASLQMKQLGEQQQIPELTEPQVPLTEKVNGHVLSMITSGVCDADAYYCGPYDGGAAFVLIKDPLFPHSTEPPLSQLVRAFPQAISAFAIPDHRLALTSYLDQFGIAYTIDGHTVAVTENGGTVMTATFDEHRRLTNLEAKLGG